MLEYSADLLISLAKSVISLFIIVDPLGNIPIFIGLTVEMKRREKRKVFNTATITGFVLLLSFAVAGNQILYIFGITLQSFMVAGGILLLILAIRILVVGEWGEIHRAPESIGAVPIAVPLLVGPGAITTTILSLQEFGIMVTVASVIIVFAAVWLILRYIEPIYSVLGKNGSVVISKVMALLIAAIAIQYIMNGLKAWT